MRLDPSASDLLLLGLVLLVTGGLLAMKGVIREEAESVFARRQPARVTMRRHLPRRGICPVGVTLMLIGAFGVIASYFARL